MSQSCVTRHKGICRGREERQALEELQAKRGQGNEARIKKEASQPPLSIAHLNGNNMAPPIEWCAFNWMSGENKPN